MGASGPSGGGGGGGNSASSNYQKQIKKTYNKEEEKKAKAREDARVNQYSGNKGKGKKKTTTTKTVNTVTNNGNDGNDSKPKQDTTIKKPKQDTTIKKPKQDTTTKTVNTVTGKSADDTKIAYKTSDEAIESTKKAAAISEKNKIKKDMEDFANLKYEPPKFGGPAVAVVGGLIGEKTFNVNKEYYTKNVIGKVNPATGKPYSGSTSDFESYMKGRGEGKLDAMGRTITSTGGGDSKVTEAPKETVKTSILSQPVEAEAETKVETVKKEKKEDEYDVRKIKKRGRRRNILTSSKGVTTVSADYSLGKPSLLGSV